MNIPIFWELIDETQHASKGDLVKQVRLLVSALMQTSREEIIIYDNIFRDMMTRAYRADLWEAADIIGCGCSDDGFRSFRAWLIGQGKDVFDKALTDPETLTDVIAVERRGDTQDGRIAPVAYYVYRQKVGSDLPIILRDPPALIGVRGDIASRSMRYPRLTDKFENCEDWWKSEFDRDFGKN